MDTREQNTTATDALIDEYEAWNKAQGLNLGSADEHLFDEELTQEQRDWLKDFVKRWNVAMYPEKDEDPSHA